MVVDDIICGRLMLQLFDRIDIAGIIAIPCFVHDRKQAVALKYTIPLMLLKSTSPDFRLRHEKAFSDTVSYDDLMVIQVRSMDDTGA